MASRLLAGHAGGQEATLLVAQAFPCVTISDGVTQTGQTMRKNQYCYVPTSVEASRARRTRADSLGATFTAVSRRGEHTVCRNVFVVDAMALRSRRRVVAVGSRFAGADWLHKSGAVCVSITVARYSATIVRA